MSGRSVATYNDPEFLNITSVSPLMSKCNIKVLYLGGNRNGSFITKEKATSMAETLRGCPIAGHYIENKEDFGGHGQKLVIDDDGFHFQKETKPYGFVDLNSKIWFQDFIDTDEFGYIKSSDGVHTNKDKIYVAGDVREKNLRQLTTAVSDGAIAATTAILELDN